MLPREQSQGLYYHWTKNAFEKRDRYFVIAYRGEQPAGFLLFTADKDSKTSVIELIAVSQAHQGEKIGDQMVGQMKSFVYENGIDTIKVGTQADNSRAIRFYTRNGFEYSGVNTVYHLWNQEKEEEEGSL